MRSAVRTNMPNEKILVVDDEKDILDLLRYNLEKERYQVTCTSSGEQALVMATQIKPDLVLLDLMLPGVDGLEVCRKLRSHPVTARVPTIMLTAKGEDLDIVTGLEVGADDYITKPFSVRVVLARVRAALRRVRDQDEAESDKVISVHDVTIDPNRHEVLVHETPVTLTATEFRILRFLALRPGRVYTRDQIISAVRGEDYAVTDRSVDVTIVGLRKKLGEAGRLVETVRGVGYRFKE
jgi:two-component system, OmpR family, alkaline phosphatase synthesis response regulator PhoP